MRKKRLRVCLLMVIETMAKIDVKCERRWIKGRKAVTEETPKRLVHTSYEGVRRPLGLETVSEGYVARNRFQTLGRTPYNVGIAQT
jgi:hypothetical protein